MSSIRTIALLLNHVALSTRRSWRSRISEYRRTRIKGHKSALLHPNWVLPSAWLVGFLTKRERVYTSSTSSASPYESWQWPVLSSSYWTAPKNPSTALPQFERAEEAMYCKWMMKVERGTTLILKSYRQSKLCINVRGDYNVVQQAKRRRWMTTLY